MCIYHNFCCRTHSYWSAGLEKLKVQLEDPSNWTSCALEPPSFRRPFKLHFKCTWTALQVHFKCTWTLFGPSMWTSSAPELPFKCTSSALGLHLASKWAPSGLQVASKCPSRPPSEGLRSLNGPNSSHSQQSSLSTAQTADKSNSTSLSPNKSRPRMGTYATLVNK